MNKQSGALQDTVRVHAAQRAEGEQRRCEPKLGVRECVCKGWVCHGTAKHAKAHNHRRYEQVQQQPLREHGSIVSDTVRGLEEVTARATHHCQPRGRVGSRVSTQASKRKNGVLKM